MRIELTKNKIKLEYIKGSSNLPILSILICTLEERKIEFLNRILSILKPQINKKDVEKAILYCKKIYPSMLFLVLPAEI